MKILDSIPHNREYEDDGSKGVIIIDMKTYNALSEEEVGYLYEDINTLSLGEEFHIDISEIHDTITLFWGN